MTLAFCDIASLAAQVGVVVIGRNEGDRLCRCLESIRLSECPVVYVDSGSTDGSVEAAHSRAVWVVELDTTIPFSAARARNAGFAKLLEMIPDLGYVQFVDGDCELTPGWLGCGVSELEARPTVAAVCGRLRERFRESSVYNRLCDVEWDAGTGEVAECGGLAMFRVSCFRSVGGFDPALKAGEEPELCARLRAAGWKIVRLTDEMALHDAAMKHFSEWWTRCSRTGYGAIDVATRFGLRQYARQVRSAQLWSIGCTGATILAICLLVTSNYRTAGVALLGATLFAFLLQTARVGLGAFRKTGELRTAAAYGFFTMLAKWPQAIGNYRCLYQRLSRCPAAAKAT